MFSRSVTAVVSLLLTASSAIALLDCPANALIPSLHPGKKIAQVPKQITQNRPGRGGWLKELNLSPEQIQKIREIRNQYKDRLSQQRQAVQQAQRELKDLMAGNASADQVRQKHSQMQTLQQQLADTRMESMLAIRAILTPEQRQKLTEVMRQQRQSTKNQTLEK